MENEENLLFLANRLILISNGLKDGSIRPFGEEIYDRLRNYYFACMPINLHIKYFVPHSGPGHCDDRSYLLSYAFDDCEIVYGHLKSLEIEHGKDHDIHFWVESKGICYDPSSLRATDKDLYYESEGVSDTTRISKEEIAQSEIAKYINSLSLDVYINDEFRRRDLKLLSLFTITSEVYETNEEFREEYNNFLKSVGINITDNEKGLKIN